MACYWPVSAYRDRDSGSVSIGYHPGAEGDRFEVPCYTCIGCRSDRARAWSIRITHEAQLHRSNWFVTLDYAPESLRSWSLEYSDFQKFCKRLRKRIGRFRFFCAGEYGSQYMRPHFHAILFGADIPDVSRLWNGEYRSEALELTWGKGHVHVGEVTAQSAAYVAGYTVDKVYRDPSAYEDLVDPHTGEVTCRVPEFVRMSRRPGIGAEWYEKYGRDLFPHDFAVQEGRRWKVPRFYTDRLRSEAGSEASVEAIEFARYERARAVPRSESSEERRSVKDELAWRRAAHFSRSH